MKNLLRSEELVQLVLCIFLLAAFALPWWTYLLLAVGPDIGMVGYLANARTGAFTYNLFHHKGLALVLVAVGFTSTLGTWTAGFQAPWLLTAGVILYGHSCMDRLLGFGLKFNDHFQHTHLGWIGSDRRPDGKPKN